ncbi:ATP-binding protein [Streptomyces murinus]|uniref:ATP-binding protein n=1 Tax=Streptomyces murinus TaxID=33900 RepID=UPI0018F53C6B|nr:ATP-binding protein [Streptomyces murinus]
MDDITPINLDDWQPILEQHNLTPDFINQISGNPHDHPTIARHEIHRATHHIPFIYQHATTDHPDVRTWADSLITTTRDQTSRIVPKVGQHRSLLLLGPTGVGKTYQAYGALRYLAPTGIRLAWLAATSADLYANLRPRTGIDGETEFRRYAHAPLLLIDDLGAAKVTEFTEDVNFRLVNHRYENQLPTIFTSNVLPKELAERVGDRVASRLIQMCDRVVIQGQDRRRQVAA